MRGPPLVPNASSAQFVMRRILFMVLSRSSSSAPLGSGMACHELLLQRSCFSPRFEFMNNN